MRVVISNELEWKKYTNQVRNKTCLWKCWEKEQKQGIRHCRYCSETYKPSVSTYGNVYKLCCPDCTAIVTKINYKLVDWQKEKFKNGRFYKKKVRESKI